MSYLADELSVGEVGFSTRVLTVFRDENVRTVGDVRKLGERGLMIMPGFGKTSLAEVRDAIGGWYAGREVPADEKAWAAFLAAAKAYAAHLDQWDKVKFQTEYGMVYLSIGRADPYPDSFDEVA